MKPSPFKSSDRIVTVTYISKSKEYPVDRPLELVLESTNQFKSDGVVVYLSPLEAIQLYHQLKEALRHVT